MYWPAIIDELYPPGGGCPARDILLRHSRQVCDLALAIARADGLHDLDPVQIEDAAMLHDVGIVMTDAPSIHCHGTLPYIRHGVAGAALLRARHAPEWAARVAERHTGAGITPQDIAAMGLPLPADADLMPRTRLERLICYADKFYSKNADMAQKSLQRVRQSMARHSEDALRRFDALHAEFHYQP